ncbi:MAG: peptide deformylase [Anaerolineae bacterium]
MAIRQIVYANDPRLRDKAKKVKQFGPRLKQLADDMLETMHAAHGVGLAGPQIGVLQRIFVAELPKNEDDNQSGKPYVLINPEIVRASHEMEEGEEGCLSIPTWYGLVNRHTWVQVKARDVRGKAFKIKVEGLLARVFQHEIDHLNGVLFIDYIDDEEKLWQVLPEEKTEPEEETALEETM